MIKPRIALVVNARGEWVASGYSQPGHPNGKDEDSLSSAYDQIDPCSPEASYIITVEVPVPETQEVEGQVISAAEESTDLDGLARAKGFAGEDELVHLVSCVKMQEPGALQTFKTWQYEDGSKRGLLRCFPYLEPNRVSVG